jgi:hypothetical protein
MKKTKLHGSPDFERYHKFNIKTAIRKKEYTIKLTTFWVYRSRNRTLWRFAKNTGEQTQEAIKLVYADNDIVYVEYSFAAQNLKIYR